MTKSKLKFWVLFTMVIYFMAVIIGLVLKVKCPELTFITYDVYKDLVPLILAIPTAWLGYCFSLRISFVAQLREIWKELNQAVQHAVHFLDGGDTSTQKFHEAQIKLRIAIDEVRSVFKNIGEKENKVGLYPYEEIKLIYTEFSKMSHGEKFDVEQARTAKTKIIKHWKNVRLPILNEFERTVPSTPSSPYLS